MGGVGRLGHRGYFDKVVYWSVDIKNRDYSTLIHNVEPSGTFYAKESNAQTLRTQNLGGMFQMQGVDVQIETKAQISDLKPNDLIKFRDRYWIVINVQKATIHKQEQYRKVAESLLYIALRGTNYER